MPRPKVPDSARRRCAHACDRCKRRKEKCNGQTPCNLCLNRGVESECHFSGPPKMDPPPFVVRSVQLRDDMPENNSDAEIAVESLLNLSGNQPQTDDNRPPKRQRDGGDSDGGGGDRDTTTTTSSSQAPVPKLARLLKDGKGKFMFVGDSAGLSFLQNIRRLVKSSIGDCPLTVDHRRHSMVENTPKETLRLTLPIQLRPDLTMATEYFDKFLLATSGVLDLFDPEELISHLPIWLDHAQAAENEITTSLFYLILAIGAQARQDGGDEKVAELLFNHGRQLAITSFMDDPSVLTVQSYVLITMYMIGTCRRNGAFMNLGIAVRAAHALGLHRPDISGLFHAQERRTRERVWKSVRLLDLFLSASLGRPPATSVSENDVKSGNQEAEETDPNMQPFRAIVRLFPIFERIINEVYGKRVVSTDLAEGISQQHREWATNIPAELQINQGRIGEEHYANTLRDRLGLAHLHCFFNWSIILLTRPFLIYQVSADVKRGHISDPREKSQCLPLIATFADACIDSAARCLDIIHDLVQQPEIAKCMPILVNSTFESYLVLGVAYFGDYDRTFPLSRGLDQARAILNFWAPYDKSAIRFCQILENLQFAVDSYVHQRDSRVMETRRRLVSDMFGQVLKSSSTTTPTRSDKSSAVYDQQPVSQKQNEAEMTTTSITANRYQPVNPDNRQWDHHPTPVMQDGHPNNQEPASTVTTALGMSAEPIADNQVFTMLPPFSESGISNLSPDSLILHPYTDNIPLFPIPNDYDTFFQSNFILDAG